LSLLFVLPIWNSRNEQLVALVYQSMIPGPSSIWLCFWHFYHNSKTYNVYWVPVSHQNLKKEKSFWITFKTVNFARWTLFLKQCVECVLHPLFWLQKATHWFFKREQAYVAVSVRTKQEIAIECFNTNSKRCPCSLFFHRETQETRIGLRWCINQRFVNQILHCTLISHCYPTSKTYNVYWVLCLSTNLKRKKKEEVKYAWHCAFRKKTTEMAGRVVLWWPMLIGRWEKPT